MRGCRRDLGAFQSIRGFAVLALLSYVILFIYGPGFMIRIVDVSPPPLYVCVVSTRRRHSPRWDGPQSLEFLMSSLKQLAARARPTSTSLFCRSSHYGIGCILTGKQLAPPLRPTRCNCDSLDWTSLEVYFTSRARSVSGSGRLFREPPPYYPDKLCACPLRSVGKLFCRLACFH